MPNTPFYEILIRGTKDGTAVQGAHAKLLSDFTTSTGKVFPAGVAVPLDQTDFEAIIGSALTAQVASTAALQTQLDTANASLKTTQDAFTVYKSQADSLIAAAEAALATGTDAEKLAAANAVLAQAQTPIIEQKKQALLAQAAALQAQAAKLGT